jgi:primary-amine oxidase
LQVNKLSQKRRALPIENRDEGDTNYLSVQLHKYSCKVAGGRHLGLSSTSHNSITSVVRISFPFSRISLRNPGVVLLCLGRDSGSDLRASLVPSLASLQFFLRGDKNMSVAPVSLAPVLSTLSLVTISGLSAITLFQGIRKLGNRHARLIAAGCAMVTMFFLALPAAHATDVVIINGAGCQVTEEDAVGILHHDLYLRIDYPNTHWRFGLRNMGLKGPQILDTTIMGAQYNSPQYIIKRAGMAEMFVPYDDRSHTYYDMSFGDDRMDQMDPQDLPAQNGALVYFRTLQRGGTPVYIRDSVPKVAVECRDEGVGWLCKEPGSRVRRRIQEVVVWAVFDAFNYDYIIEYTFHEDGRITFRSGATGYNLPGDTSEPHVHNGLWRVSTKLLGRDDNEAQQFVHVEDANGYIATDSYQPIPNEETADWDPLQFSSITVQSQTQTNDYGHLIGYQFYPYNRQGTGHFQETFTQHDQDLTNNNPGEDGTGTGMNNWLYTWYSPNSYLLSYLNGQPLGGTGDGIVLWYFGSTHHEPTDADNQMGSGGRTGITLVHWSGFEMVPHNFFDYNPLGGPPKCGNSSDLDDARLLTMHHH